MPSERASPGARVPLHRSPVSGRVRTTLSASTWTDRERRGTSFPPSQPGAAESSAPPFWSVTVRACSPDRGGSHSPAHSRAGGTGAASAGEGTGASFQPPLQAVEPENQYAAGGAQEGQQCRPEPGGEQGSRGSDDNGGALRAADDPHLGLDHPMKVELGDAVNQVRAAERGSRRPPRRCRPTGTAGDSAGRWSAGTGP